MATRGRSFRRPATPLRPRDAPHDLRRGLNACARLFYEFFLTAIDAPRWVLAAENLQNARRVKTRRFQNIHYISRRAENSENPRASRRPVPKVTSHKLFLVAARRSVPERRSTQKTLFFPKNARRPEALCRRTPADTEK